MMYPSTSLVFLFYWLLHRLHDATIYRDTGRKWECTTNVPSFGPDYYMQSQLVGNYSEKLCLSFFPLICYLRQLWHDKRAWKGLEQQINVTDTKHLKLSFSLTTSAHSPLNNLGCTYILFKPDFLIRRKPSANSRPYFLLLLLLLLTTQFLFPFLCYLQFPRSFFFP